MFHTSFVSDKRMIFVYLYSNSTRIYYYKEHNGMPDTLTTLLN